MPVTLKKSLCEVFPLIPANVYYSIYSINSSFRNKWLPAAMPVERALANLKEYQQVSKKIIKFHGAFIKGENDSEQDVEELMNTIAEYSFHSEFNIVRYNPYSSQQGEESLRVDDIAAQIQQYMPCKIIPKVGQDVYASCGQFVPK
jgi:adenine C2-methylase RlmN of 23S rRNA A2503 and tRNA A37